MFLLIVIRLMTHLVGKKMKRSVWEPGGLLTTGYADETIKKYKEGVRRFVEWCYSEGQFSIFTMEELDETLSDFIQSLYDSHLSGELLCSKSTAENALHGIIMLLPRCEYELSTARRAIRNWKRKEVGISYPPITRDLCVMVATNMMSRGKERHAVGTLLAFDCCLRVSEMTSLVKEDIADVGDTRMGSGFSSMSIRLKKTKTGPNQFVAIRDPAVVKLVRRLLADTRSGSWLFSFTSAQYRYEFKKTCSILGLSSDYVPHSLRHGGATHLFLKESKSIDFIMHHGRWASSKSARRYIQQGRALLFNLDVSSQTASAAAVLAVDPYASLMLARSLFKQKLGI